MKPPNRSVAILVLVGVLAVLTFGTAWILRVGPFRSSDRGPVIATVDGAPIYLSEAQSRVSSLAGVHSGSGSPLSSEDWPTQILQSLVDDRLIQAEADRRGIAISSNDLAASVQEVMGMFPDLTEYQAWLDSQKIDQAEVERRLEMRLLSARVYDAVAADTTASEEQVRAFYDANPDKYTSEDGQLAPFRDVRSDVQAELETQMKDAEFTAWLEGRREAANVVIVKTDWWKDIS